MGTGGGGGGWGILSGWWAVQAMVAAYWSAVNTAPERHIRLREKRAVVLQCQRPCSHSFLLLFF